MVECATSHVDASLADANRPLAEIDIVPTQARDFSAPQAGKSEMPRMPIAIVGNTDENDSDLIGGECLEFPGLAGHAIDQCGNVSR